MRDFENFVADSTRPLIRTAYVMTGDLTEAEDLTQECFVKIAREWHRVRRMDRPLAYARTVLVRLVLDGAVKRRRRQTELSATNEERAVDPSPDWASELDLMSYLAQLSDRQRAVLVLRYLNDLSEDEIASVLGCAPGTVKSAAARGLARLREHIEAQPSI